MSLNLGLQDTHNSGAALAAAGARARPLDCIDASRHDAGHADLHQSADRSSRRLAILEMSPHSSAAKSSFINYCMVRGSPNP